MTAILEGTSLESIIKHLTTIIDFSRDLYKVWKNHFLSNDRIGVSSAVKGVLSRKSITPELANIKAPTLILWGDNDDLTDREKAEIMKDNIEGSVLEIIPRAGHMSPVEEPEKVNDLIHDFLNN